MSETDTTAADVLICGCSLLGIELVRELTRTFGVGKLRIVVVDRRRRHAYIPLIHERISGRATVRASTVESARYVESRGATFLEDVVERAEPLSRCVWLRSGQRIAARHVVVALGSEAAPGPGLPGAERMRTLKFGDEPEADRHDEAGPWIVIGGGITGVEIAGERAWARRKSGDPQVTLVHAAARLLPDLHPRAGRRAERALVRQGVQVVANTRVTAIGADHVDLSGGQHLACTAVHWAGGIRPSAIASALGLKQDRDGWVVVDRSLRPTTADGEVVPGWYVGGDLAKIYVDGVRVPMMPRAIEALRMAWTIASSLRADLRATPSAAAGESAAVAHRPLRDFPHGVSAGARSLIVYGWICLDRPWIGTWFRRFLMRRYLARYRAR